MSKIVPEVRFKGFSEEWEYQKLVEQLKVNSGRDYKHLQKGDIPVYGTGGYMLSVNESLSIEDSIGLGRKGTINKPQILKAPFWTVDTLFFLTPKKDYHLYFLFSELTRINWKKYDESTGVPSLSKETINQVTTYVPNFKEQQKIGDFFKQLDDTIALQQQLVEQQQQYKKAMLQKMFPQKGELVPKVRFKGFSGDWENQKVNNLVTPVVREVPKPTYSYKRLSVRSHAKGTFHQIVEDPSTVAMDKLYVIKENDLVVNITFAWEHAIAVAKKEDADLLVSHRFPTFIIDKSDINFIKQLVSKEDFRRKLDLISPGGAGRNRVLNKKDFLSLNVLVPKHIEEQQKIGTFFKQLDDTITLHEKKLEDYQHLKKALLQRMFV
ncbi:restriction endonuclease subunit S [Priestia flexa]|uniref:restriction endonuclease subunit S n=1 Tax=Priestia flexa TaxID=86664 RepID=UPI00209EAE6C|nr:restriction endonuclease subunit S [Priestia flexa]MCP1191490.1 restriction endonuclease subunit S [Priestia flexa]